ncbi:FAD/NAD(P)-dependent oxidoreductase [Roseovarius gahaiensis]|nr:FAD/NAD(P)-binding oxidoreductase [Roseovarius gahaiensis]
MTQSDIAIIGAGPAGMAAAATAARHGATVTLLDEQPRPGGQIYRDVDRVNQPRADILGKDYQCGATLTRGLRDAGITHVKGAVVWAIEDSFTVSYTQNGQAAQVSADRVILATGALERPMPLPGWTLPGVMTAGAGQILLKQSGVLASNAVLVGSGPLLYLIAAQMVRAGTPPRALVETQSRYDLLRAGKHFGGALRGAGYLVKGLKLLAQIIRARVPRYTAATDITIEGDTRAEAVTFRNRGRTHRIACDTVLLHHGVVPNTQAARSIEVPHLWDNAQHCFSPVTDQWGATPVEGVFIAGDSAGIGGATVAERAGRISALKALEELGQISPQARDDLATSLLRQKAKENAVRPFLDTAYPPCAQALSPADSTLVCRCEEVRAGDIRQYAKLGCLGPNQAKAFGRAGMGPCQGRYCGLSVTAILAQENSLGPDDTGYLRIRPPIKPVTLGELAAMHQSTPADAAE